jgi:ribulose 1,5-bisphosphate synthetase/thiazole synthase
MSNGNSSPYATGKVVGGLPLWAEEREQFAVVNTNEICAGLFVTGMKIEPPFSCE